MKTLFKAEQFTPTKWDTAEQKAKFANHFVRFVESGFKATLFSDWFYRRLSMTFGHIAYYDRGGFYEHFFTSHEGRTNFACITLEGGGYGDPRFTYSDVEKALKQWVINSNLKERLSKDLTEAIERNERKELVRLQAKYGGIKCPQM